MLTSELFKEITTTLLLSPSAECELKNILIGLDGEEMENDLEEE